MVVFGLQVLGQIMMIVALSGAFNDESQYSVNGGFDINREKYL
jgi:hypothetical protein